ncbi:hypothetical protein C2U70_05755 [Bradyrhizobium guangdongense]|nr:hypothetical protein C2U70_05755 [Bradyrhizobium guangdongense]
MRSIEPGIHWAAEIAEKWIPGSPFGRPGMTSANENPAAGIPGAGLVTHRFAGTSVVKACLGFALD